MLSFTGLQLVPTGMESLFIMPESPVAADACKMESL